MRHLPALKVVFFLAIGIAAARWWTVRPEYILAASLLLLISSILFDKHLTTNILLSLSIISSGFYLYESTTSFPGFSPFNCCVKGRITEPSHYSFGKASFPLKLERIQISPGNYINTGEKVWIRTKFIDKNLNAGDEVLAYGSLTPNPMRRNPGDFDLKRWRERNGFVGVLSVSSAADIQEVITRMPLKYRIINRISKTIDNCYVKNYVIIKTLILGSRRDIDPSFMTALRVSGLTHLIALSGLHIGFVAILLFTLGVVLRLRISWRIILVIAGVLIYASIVPARASTLRAVIMTVILVSAPLFKRWSHTANSLAFAALLILIIRPGDMFDAGFQLSFSAVTGIFILFTAGKSPRLTSILRKSRIHRFAGHYLVLPFMVSLAASLMTLPLTSHHFGILALGAPLFNLLAIPILAFIFAGSAVSILTALLIPWLGSLFAEGIDAVISVWKAIVYGFATFSPTIETSFTPLTVIALLSFFVFISLAQKSWKVKTILALLFVTCVVMWDGSAHNQQDVKCWFLDVGHGDAAVILFPEGQTVVVDGGPKPVNKLNTTINRVLKYLRLRSVDLLAATHPEADHIGGLINVIEEFPVRAAISSHVSATTNTYRELQQISIEKGVNWRIVRAGDVLRGFPPQYEFSILNPPIHAESWSANDASVVMRITTSHKNGVSSSLLLTGDIEKKAEQAIIGPQVLNASLLKVPHHGSHTSSSAEFIKAVNPAYAVISTGNEYEYKGSSATGSVRIPPALRDAEVFLTSESGAVLFESSDRPEDQGWRQVNWRDPPFFAWLFGKY